MNSNKEFIIPFEGLKRGKHTFEFEITDVFFEAFSYSIIQGANVKVVFLLDKKETMMIGHFELTGIVKMPCDRCTNIVEVPIEFSHELYYKFGEEDSGDENLIVLPSSAFTIDISTTVYELLSIALPSRCVHKEDECNEDMLALLEQYESYIEADDDEEEDEGKDVDDVIGEDVDPRWNQLKKLK